MLIFRKLRSYIHISLVLRPLLQIVFSRVVSPQIFQPSADDIVLFVQQPCSVLPASFSDDLCEILKGQLTMI